MKLKHFILAATMFFGTKTFAQVGIGTTSPVSTLDVRGSASFNTRSVAATTTLTSTDHTIIYAGSAIGTLTLPSAAACAGREIWIKNNSGFTVTIATSALQTIDGNSTWTIANQYETALFMSDGTNWIVKQQATPANGSPDWKQGGNAQTTTKNFGTTSAYDLPIITNNTERMRILSTGNVGIGTTSPGSTLDVKGTLRLSGSTSGYVGFTPPAAAGAITYTLPSADGSSGQQLTTNGSGTLSWAAAGSVSSVSNTSSTNTLSTTVNGVSGSGVSIINSNSLTGASSALTSTVNGVASTLTPTSGTIGTSTYLGFDASGNLVKGATPSTSHTLSSSTNTITSVVNGVSVTAPAVNSVSNTSSTNTLSTTINGVAGTGVNIINSNGLTAASSALTSTVNGVASTLTPSAGTIGASSFLGFDASGNLVKGSSSGSSGWGLTGNSGTTAGTNFLGTTDNQALVLKSNNAASLRLESNGSATNMTVGNNTNISTANIPSTIAGGSSNAITNSYSFIGGGQSNSVSGQYSVLGGGYSNTNAGTKAFLGSGQSITINTGNYSSLIGGYSNTLSGDANFIAGGQSNTINASTSYSSIGGGFTNTITGSSSCIPGGTNMKVGSNSFGFSGSSSGVTDLSGTSGIAAFNNVNLYIGNTNSTAQELRMYEPNSSTTYSGTHYTAFKAVTQSANITYTLPTADGSSGQMLSTNGSGTLSWATPTNSFPSILVSATCTNAYTPASSYATVVYNSATTNVGSAYSTSTGTFTAPATGLYQISFNNLYSVANSSNNTLKVRIIVNSATETEVAGALTPYSGSTIYGSISGTTTVSMTSGQTAYIQTGGLSNTMTPNVGTGQHTLKIIRLN